MNKIIKKISAALQLVLLAPIKLPGKAMNIVKYVALGLGILEKVTQKGEDGEDGSRRPEGIVRDSNGGMDREDGRRSAGVDDGEGPVLGKEGES